LKGEGKMNTNEIMVNEVIETTEGIATASSGKGFKVAAGYISLAVLGGCVAYKYVIKPVTAKIKAKKEQQGINEEVDNVIELEIDE
jgi:hypothetical protein